MDTYQLVRVFRQPLSWSHPQNPLQLPGNGQLYFSGHAPEGPLSIRYRQGGEVMDVPGRGRRDLKRLLNETACTGLYPWQIAAAVPG